MRNPFPAALTALFLFLSAFAFYLHGAAPVLDGGDSGEFIASSHVLGIAHAPGYPVYSLAAKTFQSLIPLGGIAFRCHAFSALIMALVLVAFYFLLLELTDEKERAAALAAVFFLGSRALVIEQARVVEVFGLNALFLVLILSCLMKKWREPVENERWLFAAGFLFGFGLGNHQTLLVALPFLAVAASRPGIDGQRFLRVGLWTLAGFSVYFYLPARAIHHPPVNFGDPETWNRFWAVLTRREFGSLALHPAALPFRDFHSSFEQTLRFLRRSREQLGWGGLILIHIGFITGWADKRTRVWTALGLLGWVAVGCGFELFSNLAPTSDIGQWRLERFFLIPLLGCALVAFMGFKWMFSKPGWAKLAGAALAVACLTPSLRAHIRGKNFRTNFVFQDFAVSALRCVPPNGRLVIDRVIFDEPTSALLVRTVVEKKRPDVVFFYRPGTLFAPIYGVDVLDLPWEKRVERQRMVEDREIRGTTNPVRCLAFEKGNTPFRNPVLAGLLYAEEETPGVSSVFIDRSRYSEKPEDYPSRLIKIHFPYFAGKAALDRRQPELAARWFNVAMEQSGGMAWLFSNIGGLQAQAGNDAAALAAFERAVAQDPYFYAAQFGLGYAALQLHDNNRALAAFDSAVRLAPDQADGYYMRGVAYSLAGRPEEAVPSWNRYLELEPHGKMAEAVRRELDAARTRR